MCGNSRIEFAFSHKAQLATGRSLLLMIAGEAKTFPVRTSPLKQPATEFKRSFTLIVTAYTGA
jgi:hypothetical protein